jgi:hypothetical protein
MLEKIRFDLFIISFCVGIFFVYAMTPKRELVNKFPSPDNTELIYADKNESCYKYKPTEVDCDADSVPQPVIEDFENK